MSSILLPKESVILFLASFSSKDKAEIHFEERDGIAPQLHHTITLDMWMVFKRNDNKLDWYKTKVKPYFHQISLECIEELVESMESKDIEDMDCDTCFKMQVFCRNGGKYIIVHA